MQDQYSDELIINKEEISMAIKEKIIGCWGEEQLKKNKCAWMEKSCSGSGEMAWNSDGGKRFLDNSRMQKKKKKRRVHNRALNDEKINRRFLKLWWIKKKRFLYLIFFFMNYLNIKKYWF